MIRQASLTEVPEIIDKLMPGSDNDAHWTVGFYPDEALLVEHVKNGSLYVLDDGQILGAAVLNTDCIEDYDSIPWESPGPAYFIHLFASFCRGSGNGRKLLEGLKEEAKKLGAGCLRLDTIDGNEAAMRFYRSCGFKDLGRFKLDYDATEIEDFEVFEYGL